MLHQVGDDDGGRAGHAGLAVDEKALSTLMSFLCGTERQAVRGSVSFCTGRMDSNGFTAQCTSGFYMFKKRATEIDYKQECWSAFS